METASGIMVNGVKITPHQINEEVQYHPSESLFSSKYEATQALIIRELLIQRAVTLKLCTHNEALENTDEIIEKLFEKEIIVSDVDKEVCWSFYKQNSVKFFTSPLFEAAHIFYPALPNDKQARNSALEKAQKALVSVTQKSGSFENIAKMESACYSAKMGGHLGQITKGQTTLAFEAALLNMQEGEISEKPLASEFGYHIIKVHKRFEGKQLPFEMVHEWIADYLQRKNWQHTFSQYVKRLVAKARVCGFQIQQDNLVVTQ